MIMKKILIALDYDPAAEKVAEAGYSLAKEMRAETILIHVVSNFAYYSSIEHAPVGFIGYIDTHPNETDIIESAKRIGQDLLDKSKLHLGDNAIKTIVADGDFASSILDTAKELDVDIIVMGSHGRKWLEAIVLGSVTEKILHHTSIPLFIIPTRQKNKL
jgi:nucleotide-binding universal stress UspA family protein